MQHFADMDSDGDGFITAEDLYLFAATLGHNLTFKQVWDLLDDKDNDSDGGFGGVGVVGGSVGWVDGAPGTKPGPALERACFVFRVVCVVCVSESE